jgi:hypothetical protein
MDPLIKNKKSIIFLNNKNLDQRTLTWKYIALFDISKKNKYIKQIVYIF